MDSIFPNSFFTQIITLFSRNGLLNSWKKQLNCIIFIVFHFFRYDTAPNPKGLCSLSPTSDKALLAFPITSEQAVSAVVNNKISASGVGRVQIVDLAHPDNQPISIVAHDTRYTSIFMKKRKNFVKSTKTFSHPFFSEFHACRWISKEQE